jgi:hypothetical protein
MFCKFNIVNERYTPDSVRVYRSRIAIQYDRRGAARRGAERRSTAGAPMQAFAELPAVIIRAAIVVVINQSLTLRDSRIVIYAEYLACAVYESVDAF